MRIIFGLLALVVALVIYAFRIEPFLLRVEHVEYGSAQSQTKLKVVQLSDIHISKAFTARRLEKVVEQVNAQKPDLIIFTGDLFDDYDKFGASEEPELIEKLSQLNAKYKKIAILGNHDHYSAKTRARKVLEASDFRLLSNEGVNLTIDSQRIFIGGLADSLSDQPDIDQMMAMRYDADYTLLLTHEPDVADDLTDFNAQLILAGHSHGGQIWVPGRVRNALSKKYVNGQYQLANQTQLYVNSGIGTTMIHARFGVVPEIAAITIHL
ncbi:metallophosphoesterase [Lapidilactobacillus mulanensis]|uniref:Metallophosphoesterase n=1 Tax=Lapidilactobacillus mulanensis TaxID=2485999 RepID=A0ABW4DIZ2_9LACO|nr:metallophosphoesterase [Lapidilactobacillus mulanensis]